MRVEVLWSGFVTVGWMATIVSCHSAGNELETVRYGPSDEFPSNSYTVAYINMTYKEEHAAEIYSDFSESGKYGEGFVDSARGVAVHIRAKGPGGERDHTGCTRPLLSVADPDKPLPREPWIAVVKRGSCSFEIKVQNAWHSNASAVLVYNDRDNTVLEKMKLTTDDGRNISAVFTYKWKGEEIASLIDNGTRVMLSIVRGKTLTHINNNINKTSVLFVSISFIVLMVISLAWLVFYYIQRFRYIHAKDRLSKRLCCAAKKALSKIPVRNLKSDDRELNEAECCAICIEPYKVSETLRSLPCRHEFHKSCIDPWLLEHRTCPMCKMDILKYYGFVFTGSQESILQLEAEESRSRAITPSRNNRHPLTLLPSGPPSAQGSARSSRASSPDELVPREHRPHPHIARSCTSTPEGNHSRDLPSNSSSCPSSLTSSCELTLGQ